MRHSSLIQSTLTVGGSITVWPVSGFTGLDCAKQENMLVFESNPFKLETSRTVILPLAVSVLWINLSAHDINGGRFVKNCFTTSAHSKIEV